MAREKKDNELYHIVKVIWEDRFLKQNDELHVMAALLISENHTVKLMSVTAKHAFVNLMHSFLSRYVSEKKKPRVMKN